MEGSIRDYLVDLTFELNKLGQSVDCIVMSEEWHDRLNLETNEPLKHVDTFYRKKYMVAPDLQSPYYLLIKPGVEK